MWMWGMRKNRNKNHHVDCKQRASFLGTRQLHFKDSPAFLQLLLSFHLTKVFSGPVKDLSLQQSSQCSEMLARFTGQEKIPQLPPITWKSLSVISGLSFSQRYLASWDCPLGGVTLLPVLPHLCFQQCPFASDWFVLSPQAILFLTPTSFPYAVPFCLHPLYIQFINFHQGSFRLKGEAGTRVQAHRQWCFLHPFVCMCVCVRWAYSSHNAWGSSTDFWTSAAMATISPEALELLLAGWVPQEADSETEISTEEVY